MPLLLGMDINEWPEQDHEYSYQDIHAREVDKLSLLELRGRRVARLEDQHVTV